MIKEDRKALNDRFIIIYRLLEEKGVIVKNNPKKSLGNFAEIVLGQRYGHVINQWLKEERFINYSQARIICDTYGVNREYFLDGLGEPFGDSFEYPGNTPQAEENLASEHRIAHSPIPANAGTSIDVGYKYEDFKKEFFMIPGLKKAGLTSFIVSGDSMYPKLDDGDVVICEHIQSFADLKNNAMYAVNISGRVWVKYVRGIQNKAGRVTQLKLISENFLEHDPFIEDVTNHTKLHRVLNVIKQC